MYLPALLIGTGVGISLPLLMASVKASLEELVAADPAPRALCARLARTLAPDEFDRVWTQIAGTGWENLKDCRNGTGGKRDPVYQFDIKDDQNTASFSCQTRTVPYPYDGIVNPLDALGAKGGKQLGDDEPQELKDLEKKQPK